MARPLRLDFAGAVHHLTSRGNERRAIFRCDADRRQFLKLLGEASLRFRWCVTAYVLMTNHFHLVIRTPEANLSRGMHWLSGTYAAWFNKRHRRCGHLFQGRFHSFLVDEENYLVEVLRYVVLNPVRAKMVEHPADYRWSSYRATAGLAAAPEWLNLDAALELFGGSRAEAHRRYVDFVGMKIGSTERLWDAVVHAVYLGTESWLKRVRRIVESKVRSTDHPKTQRAVGRPRMAEVISAVAQACRTSAAVLRAQRGGPLRRLVAWIGWNEGADDATHDRGVASPAQRGARVEHDPAMHTRARTRRPAPRGVRLGARAAPRVRKGGPARRRALGCLTPLRTARQHG
jgi:putative transposase